MELVASVETVDLMVIVGSVEVVVLVEIAGLVVTVVLVETAALVATVVQIADAEVSAVKNRSLKAPLPRPQMAAFQNNLKAFSVSLEKPFSI